MAASPTMGNISITQDRHQQIGAQTYKTTTQRANPQCTHVVVDRIRGDYLCDNCHKPSPQRWLYICTQDLDLSLHETRLASIREARAKATYDLAEKELFMLNVSDSIISQWHRGVYTAEQIDMIKEQKRHAKQAIDTTSMMQYAPGTSSLVAAKTHSSYLTRPDAINSYQSGQRRILPTTTASPVPVPICNYKCCHRCRPYLRDHLPVSVESVLGDEHDPVCAAEAEHLPIVNAHTAKTMGLQVTAQILAGRFDNILNEDDAAAHEEAQLRYSPTAVTTASTPPSLCSSVGADADANDELDNSLRRLLIGSQSVLPGRYSPNFELPPRPSTAPEVLSYSDSIEFEEHDLSRLSPASSGDMSLSTVLSCTTLRTPTSSPGKGLGVPFLPAVMPVHRRHDVGNRAMYAKRDNASMESLGLNDDVVLVAV